MSEPIHRICVQVQTAYLSEHSDPQAKRFVFTYTVTIRNDGDVGARLLGRHWLIHDGDGGVQEVKGIGVVGEQPYLKPGQQFAYTSGTILHTPIGCMQGAYHMLADDGENFEAPIAPFRLAYPKTLH